MEPMFGVERYHNMIILLSKIINVLTVKSSLVSQVLREFAIESWKTSSQNVLLLININFNNKIIMSMLK